MQMTGRRFLGGGGGDLLYVLVREIVGKMEERGWW
jgi:hypothetical protein